MTLDQLNDLADEQVHEAFLACCGSEHWVDSMVASRPFANWQALHEQADAIWGSLGPEDWLEAFSRHSQIGKKCSDKWSAQEQHGMSQARRDSSEALRRMNKRYRRKFGWIFIVCATGKSAEQMRASLERRLMNDPDTEFGNAAAEQAKIMHLRLHKLFTE